MISKAFITCGIVSLFLAFSSGADLAETIKGGEVITNDH